MKGELTAPFGYDRGLYKRWSQIFLEVRRDGTRSNRLRLQRGKFQRGSWAERAVRQPAPSALIPPAGALCPSAEGTHPCCDCLGAPGTPGSPLAPKEPSLC